MNHNKRRDTEQLQELLKLTRALTDYLIEEDSEADDGIAIRTFSYPLGDWTLAEVEPAFSALVYKLRDLLDDIGEID